MPISSSAADHLTKVFHDGCNEWRCSCGETFYSWQAWFEHFTEKIAERVVE